MNNLLYKQYVVIFSIYIFVCLMNYKSVVVRRVFFRCSALSLNQLALEV